MKLNDFAIKAAIKEAKISKKTLKKFDGDGLYLEITPKGRGRWRFKYRFDGKEKLISLGLYPEISLADARDRRFENRKLVAHGINPSERRKAETASQSGSDTFNALAEEWFMRTKHIWSENHAYQTHRRLERDILPWLGKRPISEITVAEMLKVLRRVEDRGALETAHRIKSVCSQVFKYAISSERADRDPTQDLKLTPMKKKHHASITDPKKIGVLLNEIDDYEGQFITRCALKLAPLTFVRPGELRHAEWSEFNFETGEWRIPAEKMKARKIHIVPLSKQAIKVLEELRPYTGDGKYLFPSIRTPKRPMSNNAVTGALRRMGYSSEEMTGHGFRSMASTLLNEQGYNWDAIERQLAHSENNKVRAAYNYADYLPERKTMMQEWADYLEKLKTNSSK